MKPVSISSSVKNPWTKEDDRNILTTWQEESSWSTVLTRLQGMMPNRSRVEVSQSLTNYTSILSIKIKFCKK